MIITIPKRKSRRSHFLEIDWSSEFEDPNREVICIGCRRPTELKRCLHVMFRVRFRDEHFICRSCYERYRTIMGKASGRSHQERVKKATPKGVNWKEIERVYIEAQIKTFDTGILHHVDHIIPLIGRDSSGRHVVSGLHVSKNLRVIPWYENLRKSNKFEIEEPVMEQPKQKSKAKPTPRLIKRQAFTLVQSR